MNTGVTPIKALVKKTQYKIVYKTPDISSELVFLTKTQNGHKVTWNHKYNYRNIYKLENNEESMSLLELLTLLINKLHDKEITISELNYSLPKDIVVMKL